MSRPDSNRRRDDIAPADPNPIYTALTVELGIEPLLYSRILAAQIADGRPWL